MSERSGNFIRCGKLVAGGRGGGLCSRCRVEAYCSDECQRADWPAHKTACKAAVNVDRVARKSAPMFAGPVPPLAVAIAAAEAGDANAMYTLGCMYLSGADGVAQSFTGGQAWLARSAALPDAPREVWAALGECHRFGWGVPADDAEAVRLHRVGVALGDAEAQYVLAQCLKRGIGVPTPDRTTATELVAAAAAQDHAGAIASLGEALNFGIGVARDLPRAVALYERALTLPTCPPTLAVGAAYCAGVLLWDGGGGVARNERLGAQYLRQAAARGSAEAALALRVRGLA